MAMNYMLDKKLMKLKMSDFKKIAMKEWRSKMWSRILLGLEMKFWMKRRAEHHHHKRSTQKNNTGKSTHKKWGHHHHYNYRKLIA
jgi:hypothetical protein